MCLNELYANFQKIPIPKIIHKIADNDVSGFDVDVVDDGGSDGDKLKRDCILTTTANVAKAQALDTFKTAHSKILNTAK